MVLVRMLLVLCGTVRLEIYARLSDELFASLLHLLVNVHV